LHAAVQHVAAASGGGANGEGDSFIAAASERVSSSVVVYTTSTCSLTLRASLILAQAAGCDGTASLILAQAAGCDGATLFILAQAAGCDGTASLILAQAAGCDGATLFVLAQAAGCDGTVDSRIRTGGGLRGILFVSVSFCIASASLRRRCTGTRRADFAGSIRRLLRCSISNYCAEIGRGRRVFMRRHFDGSGDGSGDSACGGGVRLRCGGDSCSAAVAM
jgi:hypothetical protein